MNELNNENSMKYLDALYDSLIIAIKEKGKKIINRSALFTLMKMYSNDAYDVMLNSSIEIPDSVESDLAPLKQNNFIRRSELSSNRDNYIVTAKGIYFVESMRFGFDLSKMLDYIQEENMDFKIAKKPLSDKEKTIVTSLIALRSFDHDVSMDLNDEERSQKWEEIIKTKIIPFIENKANVNSQNIFSQSAGHENPVSYLMRRANDLPKKTGNMFTSMNNNQYYLKIDATDKNLATKQIAYILGKVFQNIKSIEEANEIKKYLCDVAQSQGIYVYDNFEFINFEWDTVINNAIDKIFLGVDL